MTLFVAWLIALFALAIAAGVTGSLGVAVTCAIVAALVAVPIVRKRLAPSVDLKASPRGLKIASCVAAVVAVVMLSRMTVFIVDPSRT